MVFVLQNSFFSFSLTHFHQSSPCQIWYMVYSNLMSIKETYSFATYSIFNMIYQVSNAEPFPAAPFCNDMMKELESNPVTRIMWNSVKPMLMGQILYAPDSPAVRQIIRNVSSIGHIYPKHGVVPCTNTFKIVEIKCLTLLI